MSLRSKYLEQPHEVSIETFAKCNASCSFCPYPGMDRIGEKMPMETIDRLIDEMATFDTTFYFSPFKVSDPLLDKRLYSILKKVNKKTKAITRIFTNGSALTLERAEELNDIENLELWISLNEHNSDKYKDLMNLDLARTIKNIDALHETDFRHSVGILKVGKDDGFSAFCKDKWPDYNVFIVKKDGWLGYTDPSTEKIPEEGCGRWFEISIMANGVVSLCCMDGDGKHSIGDINKSSILEIYNLPYLRDRRLGVIDRKDINPCSTCTY